MKRQNLELPNLKEYAKFLLDTYLEEFTQEVYRNYTKLQVPLLRFYQHLPETELISMTAISLKDILEKFAEGNAVQFAEQANENWRNNKLNGISREDVKAGDLVMVNNARKSALLFFSGKYIASASDLYPLLKEIEDYYSFATELAIETFGEIKQEEISQTARNLQEAQQFARVGNWQYNTATHAITWSEQMYQFYGIDKSVSLSADKVLAYIEPEDANRLKQTVRSAAKNKEPYSIEYRIIHSSGTRRTLLENGNVEVNVLGELIYRGTAQDITQLKSTENKLQENESNFRLLAENSTDIISRHLLDSTILYISPSCYSITGYLPEELLGKKAYDYYHPEDLAQMEQSYEEIVDIPDHTVVNFRFRKKDGNYIWFESIGKILKDFLGKPVEIIATNRDATERKKTELSIQKKETLLSNVLNSSIGGIQVFKSVRNDANEIIDFEYILVNDSAVKFLGYSRAQLIGNTLLQLFPGVAHDRLFEKYKLAAAGEPSSFRHFYAWEGFQNWFNIVAWPYEDGFILSTDDITAQITAEEKLLKINQELEQKVIQRTIQLEKQKEYIYSVLMQAPAMICIGRGEDLVFELANPMYLRVLGKTTDIIGKPLIEVFPEIKDQPVFDIIKKVIATGNSFVGNEVPIPLDINNDGKPVNIYFNFVYEALRNDAGVIDGMLTHAVDVTSTVLARKKLEESEEKFRSMADNIPNLAWMGEPDGHIFWFNKRWYDYTGTKPEDMEGWGWQKVYNPEELPRVLEYWNKAIHTAAPAEMIIPLRGINNQYQTFLTKVVPVFDADGKLVRWFGTHTDITSQIEAEIVLERKNKELIKINNDLDNFIYTASHDLKSPVSNLEALLTIMQEEKENMVTDSGASILDLSVQSIQRLKNVIGELTEIARIQKDVELVKDKIILQDFFHEVVQLLEKDISNYKGKIIADFSANKEMAFSKRNMRSILLNLISNSIKYSDPAKDGFIRIESFTEGDFTCIVVVDNGLGIPNNQLEKVFVMFKRFHTHIEGSGIGLYIVKRMIENAGGSIEVESEVGKGTKFKMYFPK